MRISIADTATLCRIKDPQFCQYFGTLEELLKGRVGNQLLENILDLQDSQPKPT